MQALQTLLGNVFRWIMLGNAESLGFRQISIAIYLNEYCLQQFDGASRGNPGPGSAGGVLSEYYSEKEVRHMSHNKKAA